MKKLLLSFVMMLTATVAAWADYAVIDGVRYYISKSNYDFSTEGYPDGYAATVYYLEEGVYSGEVTIPSAVTYEGEEYPVVMIQSYAFNGATVSKVTIPSTVKRIDDGSFTNCANLTAIDLPEGVEFIGMNAFDGCPLTSVTIPGSVTLIRSYAFPTSLTSLTFAPGASTLTLQDNAFGHPDDTNIADLIIDRNYDYNYGTPLSRSHVKRITVGEHVTAIPQYAFYGLTTLEQFTMGGNVEEIGSSAFQGCTLPAGTSFPLAKVKVIKNYAFQECQNMPAAINLAAAEQIAPFAFYHSSIESVTFGNSLTQISNYAFEGSSNLTTINWSASIEQIGIEAFSGCGMTSLTIPGTVTTVQSNAFRSCGSLTSIIVENGSETLDLEYNAFDNCAITDLYCDRSLSTTASFGWNLKRVTVGSHLTAIDFALSNCQFESLVYEGDVVSIGKSIFYNSTMPDNFALPQHLQTLGESAFSDARNIANIVMPITLTSIGSRAFLFSDVANVYVPWLTNPTTLDNENNGTDDQQFNFSQTLWVPGGTKAIYENATGWKKFNTIDYWSYVVTSDVAGKGTLAVANGEAVTDNGTNTEKSVTGANLVEAGAGTPVSGLFVREKDLTLTPTPARGYELSTLTANDADIKAAAKVENLLADQTIHATFTPIIYNIVYNNLLNGVVDPANPTTYTVESDAITLVNPTRTAYNFKGWTGTDLTEPTMTVTIPASSIGDREYTATWEPIVYDITYDLAGGAVDPANKDKYTIETADFTLTNPTRLGYTFTGWTGTDLTEKTMTVTVTTGHWGNRTYTATWEPNPYKVRFDINGGDDTETMADMNFVYDAAQNLTQNAFTRTGYTFKEWNSKADGTGTAYADKAEVVNLTAVRDEVVTMYAQWMPNPYQVRFNRNNGEGTMANQDFVYDTQQALTENAFTRTGYTFSGWNTAADGSADSYADKAEVKNLTAELNGIVDVYAQWQLITYTIGYDLADGTVAVGLPDSYTIETPTFTLTNPTRTGYIFAGWTGTGLSAATQTVTIVTGSYGNRTYTATWTPIHYTMKFDANNGTGTMTDQLFTYDVEMALKANAFSRSGYNFKNWNTKADGTGTTYTNQQSLLNLTVTDGASFTLYAQWQIIPYIIGYDLAGGTVATANPTEYNVETETFTLTNPTREGYEFTGWEGTGITGTATTVTIAKGSIGDRAYTATWTPIVYTISYDLADGTVATDNPTEYTIETPTFTLTNPTKAHWVFTGWTGTGLSTATQTVTIAKGSIGTRTYTATWERETYTVSITSNVAGMVTASTSSPKYEDDVVLTIGTDEDLDLVSVVVDGVDVTAQIAGGKYTIQHVSANVSVVVTFASNKEFIRLEHPQATFSCSQALDFTGTGLKAYIASGFMDCTVLLTQVDVVPANTGLLLVGTEGATYKVPYTTTKTYYVNLLKPVLTAQVIPTTSGEYTNYLYGEVNNVKGFYKSSGSGEVTAKKAYLQLPTSAVSGARVDMRFEDETTGIENANVNVNDNRVYNLNGLKVADEFNPKRLPAGVYIVNGKKMVVK